jgi:hypothetical protein
MTVAELIAELQKHEPGRLVVVNMHKNELANGCEARSVAAVPAFKSAYDGVWYEGFAEPIDDGLGLERATVVNVEA